MLIVYHDNTVIVTVIVGIMVVDDQDVHTKVNESLVLLGRARCVGDNHKTGLYLVSNLTHHLGIGEAVNLALVEQMNQFHLTVGEAAVRGHLLPDIVCEQRRRSKSIDVAVNKQSDFFVLPQCFDNPLGGNLNIIESGWLLYAVPRQVEETADVLYATIGEDLTHEGQVLLLSRRGDLCDFH